MIIGTINYYVIGLLLIGVGIFFGYFLGTYRAALKLSRHDVTFYVVIECNEGKDKPICVTFSEAVACNYVAERNTACVDIPQRHYYYETVSSRTYI